VHEPHETLPLVLARQAGDCCHGLVFHVGVGLADRSAPSRLSCFDVELPCHRALTAHVLPSLLLLAYLIASQVVCA
jgi:hypothetical protein